MSGTAEKLDAYLVHLGNIVRIAEGKGSKVVGVHLEDLRTLVDVVRRLIDDANQIEDLRKQPCLRCRLEDDA